MPATPNKNLKKPSEETVEETVPTPTPPRRSPRLNKSTANAAPKVAEEAQQEEARAARSAAAKKRKATTPARKSKSKAKTKTKTNGKSKATPAKAATVKVDVEAADDRKVEAEAAPKADDDRKVEVETAPAEAAPKADDEVKVEEAKAAPRADDKDPTPSVDTAPKTKSPKADPKPTPKDPMPTPLVDLGSPIIAQLRETKYGSDKRVALLETYDSATLEAVALYHDNEEEDLKLKIGTNGSGFDGTAHDAAFLNASIKHSIVADIVKAELRRRKEETKLVKAADDRKVEAEPPAKAADDRKSKAPPKVDDEVKAEVVQPPAEAADDDRKVDADAEAEEEEAPAFNSDLLDQIVVEFTKFTKDGKDNLNPLLAEFPIDVLKTERANHQLLEKECKAQYDVAFKKSQEDNTAFEFEKNAHFQRSTYHYYVAEAIGLVLCRRALAKKKATMARQLKEDADKVEALRLRMTAVEARIEQHDGDIATLQAQHAALQAQHDALQAQIADLKAQMENPQE